MGEIGRPMGKRFNISVQRVEKTGRQHATSHNGDTQLQTCKQKAQGGEGTPTKDRISIPRTGWFQLRTVLIQACLKISVAESKILGNSLAHLLLPGHRLWCTISLLGTWAGMKVWAERLCRFVSAAQPKWSFSWSLRLVMAWRIQEAKLKSFERQRRQRCQKISHRLHTNGFLPLY